jgi:hypothetical protein
MSCPRQSHGHPTNRLGIYARQAERLDTVLSQSHLALAVRAHRRNARHQLPKMSDRARGQILIHRFFEAEPSRAALLMVV